MPIELLRRRQPSDLLPSKGAWRLVTGFEGLSLKAYPDPATGGDPWTAGYGHTGPEVTPGLNITLKQADDWLEQDLAEAAQIVRDNVNVPLTQGEFDALTSLAFNLGYLPRSMKACLNGGKTDKGEEMAPGSYGSAMKQFPRNCRAAGVPMRGLLRRRLAEACVFSDLPWENACSINLVRLKCDAAGNIDPEETTSLEETLERARQDIPIQRPDVTSILQKPFPEILSTAKDEIIAVEALPKDELVLTSEMQKQPAAPPVASPVEAKGEQPPVPASQPPAAVSPPPKPEPSDSNTGSSKPASPVPSNPPQALPGPASSPPKPTAAAPADAKNPMKSQTIWGGLLASMAPQFDQIGTILMAKAGTFGPAFMVLGMIMVVLGRVGAVQPLSTSAPIRNQS